MALPHRDFGHTYSEVCAVIAVELVNIDCTHNMILYGQVVTTQISAFLYGNARGVGLGILVLLLEIQRANRIIIPTPPPPPVVRSWCATAPLGGGSLCCPSIFFYKDFPHWGV